MAQTVPELLHRHVTHLGTFEAARKANLAAVAATDCFVRDAIAGSSLIALLAGLAVFLDKVTS